MQINWLDGEGVVHLLRVGDEYGSKYAIDRAIITGFKIDRVLFIDNAGFDSECSIDHFVNSYYKLNPIEVKQMKYKQGDILVDNKGDIRKVLGVCGEVYILSCVDDHRSASNFLWTDHDLDSSCIKLKPSVADVVELTLEDVAKLKGVPVDKIRIKE